MDLPVDCSCAAGVAAAVGATILAILAVQALLYLIWKLHSRANSGQHLVLVTDTERGDLFAYDNPGFKDGPSLVQTEKENHKENQTTLIKWPQWASIGRGLPSTNKVKAMDDSFTSQPVISVVPLRSHDFTGLGFNICGNMRDGIFVKDVLHRGPASESGRIMPGDRIESVKVSLRHMVFEDALTILSYASPYEVELAVEARRGSRAPSLVRSSHPSASHRIGHPFFRSRSIADLHQIEKSGRRLAGDGADATDGAVVEGRGRSEERLQNCRNAALEAASIGSALAPPQPPERRRAASPVRTILARGIQTLRQRLHPSPPRQSSESPTPTPLIEGEKQRSEAVVAADDDGWQTAELCVPDHVAHAGSVARAKRHSGSITEDDMSPPKRRAPSPPQVEIELAGDASSGELDSSMSGTIELDSTHVTVHQADEGRKASSLGDLSRLESGGATGSLERAASLEAAAAAAGGRKRKAPPRPPSPDCGADSSGGTLRKANVWGTLEDAMSPRPESPDSTLESRGLRKANIWGTMEDALTSEAEDKSNWLDDTPPPAIFKTMTTTELWTGQVNGGGADEGESSGDEVPPQLPTSPVPQLNYVTEIHVDGSIEERKPYEELKMDLEDISFTLDSPVVDLKPANNNNGEAGRFLSLSDMRTCDLSLCLDDRENREESEDANWADSALSGRLSRSTGNLSSGSARLSLASPSSKRSPAGRGSRIPVRRSPHAVRHAPNGHHTP